MWYINLYFGGFFK